ncbi:MAG TPA: GNAT family N-acetyltransferase [Steroidobacteraceae bacterium]|nr:GNAT family N-acetyltransferase [Steroidobacteraceae bacterium]
MALTAQFVPRIADLSPGEWATLDTGDHPFVTHAFLEALESTGCVGDESGWRPLHLAVRDESGALVAAVPQYLKAHSWGEFVFDWSWAQAYSRAGLEYYPKLLAAVPFTPVTGPRLLVRAGADRAALHASLAELLLDSARSCGASGTHVNFTNELEQAALERAGFLRRHDCRFLWRNPGYRDFEDFLEAFRAEKRKKLRRERRRVAEAGITLSTLPGEQVPPALWQTIFGFSERTFLQHGHTHYLNAEFLGRVAVARPGSVMVKLAEREARPVAAAVFFIGGGQLYGRYWGAGEAIDCLHFEACYYQGIEYCIERGLHAFDPGTQGEHKLARGFEPTRTLSAHWLAHEGFRAAVARHLEREREAVDEYIEAARLHLPFHRDDAAGGAG